MTRVNVIPAKLLTDQHLLAELREIPRIGTLVKKAHAKGKLLPPQPEDYVLGIGHVKFFYNKLGYILSRIKQLQDECVHRKFGIEIIDYDTDWRSHLTAGYFGNYTATQRAVLLCKDRILERIMLRPNWYRYNRITIDAKYLNSLKNR